MAKKKQNKQTKKKQILSESATEDETSEFQKFIVLESFFS